MEVKVKFNDINVKEEKEKTLVKILMLKGEKGDSVSAEWGTITGNINNQTDLKNALNSKANQSEVTQALNQKANASDLNNYYNKSQMNTALGSKIGTEDIVDTLDSTSSDKVLSAKQGKVLKNLADQKPYYFDTVALMKAGNLSSGDYAITKGYYSANDGGGANYYITSSSSATDYQEELNNGLYATLIINENINVKQLGAYGDGIHDDTNCFKAFATSNVKKLIIPDGTYNITDNIVINNKIIKGENSVINTISQTTTQEHQITIKGTSIINNIIFKQSNHDVSLCLFEKNNKTEINNCSFIVDNVKTNGYVDLYTENKDVTFNNCYFECNSYNSSNVQTIGGIWVRENNSNKISENIKFINCTILHNTIDEAIAIWDWNGKVNDVLIDNCVIKAKDTCTSSHFISLDSDNCILSNSIIDAPTEVSNSVLKGDFYNQVNNCYIYSHKQENNGISSGNIIFNSCKIYNDNPNCYLSVNKKNIFKNCEIEVNAITDTRNIELYNCKIKTTSTTSTNARCFIKDLIMKNCVLDIKTCQTLLETYYSDPFNVDIENCKIAIETGGFMIINNNASVTHLIKLFNNHLTRGTITAYSGHVSTGFVVGNISSSTIPSTIDGLTVANNVKI